MYWIGWSADRSPPNRESRASWADPYTRGLPPHALTFYGLEPTDDPLRWRLPVVRGLCSGFGALFGGAGLGAAIEVLERVTGRPLVCATAQFLQFARPALVSSSSR